MSPLLALALTIATTTGTAGQGSPLHGSSPSQTSAAATTTTPTPPGGVVVTITQNPDDCTMTAHVTNGTPVHGMLVRTDQLGMTPPMDFRPNQTWDLPIVGTSWSARIDWRNPHGDFYASTPVGQKALAPVCIGQAPDVEIGTPMSITAAPRTPAFRMIKRHWGVMW